MPTHPLRTLAVLSLTSTCLAAAVTAPAPVKLGPAPVLPLARPVSPASNRNLREQAETVFAVDISDREAVRRFHLGVHGASEGWAMDWSGDLDACDPGTTDPDFQEAVIRRVNYYRALVGVPAGVALDHTRHAMVQSAAFIMGRNNIITHSLPDDVACYTEEGAAAMAQSNLALGASGPEAVDGYMADWGPSNASVGHRRWLIVPQQQSMATGDVPAVAGPTAHATANAIFVLGDGLGDPRPEVRDEYVAWPPPGYVPYGVMPVRWSFSYPDADFASASVRVTHAGVEQPVTLEPLAANQGENTIVWYFTSLDPLQSYDWPQPASDSVYHVTVSNVGIGGSPRTFDYQVKVFDPNVPGPGGDTPELSGPTEVAVGSPTTYGLAGLDDVTTFEWIEAGCELLTSVEGADVDLGPFVADTTPGYDPRGQKPKFQYSKCFLLTHVAPTPAAQYLTHSGTLLPGEGAVMTFGSRISNATEWQVGEAQVSVDDGASWETLYSRSGWYDEENEFWGDLWFNPVTLSLDAYAGRLIRVRFAYSYLPGEQHFYYPWDTEINWHNGIGFYIEDVAFENVQLLSDLTSHEADVATGIVFTPPAKGSYALATRGVLFGRYPLEWGPALLVTATGEAPLSVRFEEAPAVSGGTFRSRIRLSPGQPAPVIQVERASTPNGPWEIDVQATVTALESGELYEIAAPAGQEAGFIRVQVP